MKPFTAIAAAALAAVVATSCATMGIGSYVGRGTDFTAYRTYDWGPADALPTGDPRLDANGIFVDHFVGAVEKAMAARGFARAAAGATPDLRLHFHASITERFVVSDARGLGECAVNECGPRPEVFEAGTLLLDVVDARTARLVWRGWAEDGVAGALAHQDRLEEFIEKAVIGMMRHFPVAPIRNSPRARS